MCECACVWRHISNLVDMEKYNFFGHIKWCTNVIHNLFYGFHVNFLKSTSNAFLFEYNFEWKDMRVSIEHLKNIFSTNCAAVTAGIIIQAIDTSWWYC